MNERVKTRTCPKCKETKELTEFAKDKTTLTGVTSHCKKCRAFYLRIKRFDAAKEADKEDKKSLFEEGKRRCKGCGSAKVFSEFTKQKGTKIGLRSKCAECLQQLARLAREINPETLNERTRTWRRNNPNYQKYKCQSDPPTAMARAIRSRLKHALARKNKVGSAITHLGCSQLELVDHIETLFLDGMTWANYGNKENQWSLDHIMPLSSFDLENTQHYILACHYLNLQPLWHIDNLRKGKKCLFKVQF